MEINGRAACRRAASVARQACVVAVIERTLESGPRARDGASVRSHTKHYRVLLHVKIATELCSETQSYGH